MMLARGADYSNPIEKGARGTRWWRARRKTDVGASEGAFGRARRRAHAARAAQTHVGRRNLMRTSNEMHPLIMNKANALHHNLVDNESLKDLIKFASNIGRSGRAGKAKDAEASREYLVRWQRTVGHQQLQDLQQRCRR